VTEAARLSVILEAFAAFLESQQDLLSLRDQIVVGNSRLMQRTVSMQRELEGFLAVGLARLRGLDEPDAAALMEAGVGMVVLRVAVRSWRAGGGSLLAETRESFARLRDLAAEAPLRQD
jgi:hypothetical protein